MPKQKKYCIITIGVLYTENTCCTVNYFKSFWDSQTLFSKRPKVENGEDFARIKLYWYGSLNEWSKEERIRTCYLATCYCYVNDIPVTNATLRQRFGVEEKNMSVVSRIIKETVDAGMIKIPEENMGKRNRRYVPYWL